MKNRNTFNQKSDYETPEVQRIELDKEISLQLESVVTPPKAPGEARLQTPEHFDQDPFKGTMA